MSDHEKDTKTALLLVGDDATRFAHSVSHILNVWRARAAETVERSIEYAGHRVTVTVRIERIEK